MPKELRKPSNHLHGASEYLLAPFHESALRWLKQAVQVVVAPVVAPVAAPVVAPVTRRQRETQLVDEPHPIPPMRTKKRLTRPWHIAGRHFAAAHASRAPFLGSSKENT